MRIISAAVLALAGFASAFTDVQYQSTFTAWMQKYNKVYTSEEFDHRFAAFRVNMDFVDRWNSADNGHEVELNHFADLSNSEYQRIYLGTHITVEPFEVEAFDATEPLADTVDWRTKGAVTPIKNQGQCGSCWSFSTTGSTEGAHFLKNNNLVSLSEQNLMDCSTAEGNMGCNGGLMDNAFKYIIKNGGIDSESSYPYTAKDGTCHYNAANRAATLTTYTDVAKGNEEALATAVAKAPVSVAIDASHNSFQLYKTGVYYEAACSATRLDHGVLAVGYGADGSSNYWIVKNSWGTVWGQQGYIWMSKDRKNNCGIATSASYPTA